jgi:hypothetical protein
VRNFFLGRAPGTGARSTLPHVIALKRKIAMGEIRTLRALSETEWAGYWGAVQEVSDRHGGTYRLPGRPWHFSADQLDPIGDSTLQGEHNHTVFNQSARIRYRSFRTAFLFVIMAVMLGAHASAATNEAEARALFTKFVAAQNAHSVSDVKTTLWNSPSMLLYARGVEIRGPEAVADRFKEYYKGTWHIEPDMPQFHVTSISNEVVQILVPVVFTQGLRGQPSRDNKFMVSQTYVHDANGWHIASIMPIPNTQLK